MKRIHYLLVPVLIYLLQGCNNDLVTQSILNEKPEVKRSVNLTRSRVDVPKISDNQIVARYKTNLSQSQKNLIRSTNYVIAYETCSCGDNNLELWTIDTNFISVEGIVDNFPRTGNVEGDFQFEFNIGSKQKMEQGNTTDLRERVNYSNDDDAILIGIIDTGVDYDYFNKAFLYNSRQDINCKPEISGWDFVNNDADVRDDNGHGTLVTKLITNELDSCNVNYRILAVKAFDRIGNGSYWNIVCAMNYLVNRPKKVDLVNMSFGWYSIPGQNILEDMINRAAKTTLFIASAGNKGMDTDIDFKHYPSGYFSRNLLTVGGYSAKDTIHATEAGHIIDGIELAKMSNYGTTSIDMAAAYKGYSVLLELPDENPIIVKPEGTSFACAYISSKSAQIFNNDLPFMVKNNLLNSAYYSGVIKEKLREGRVILSNETVLKE